MTAQIGLIGLGVMGANLALNLNDHGYSVAVYNRNFDATARFMLEHAQGSQFIAAETLQALVTVLPQPRIIMLMITAGKPVDSVIEQLLPFISAGDIIIDGGNSYYQDSTRRWEMLKALGIHFVGMGVSGGEEGARHGPSLMPGGAVQAWSTIKAMFQAIAAKADGQPCCQWLGEGGAGHYVKMVHNGIEYGDMQLIAETCQLMHSALGLDYDHMADIFAQWNQGKLQSYLIEITSHILRQKDADGQPLVDKILDRAGQKGTGLWTSVDALDKAVPLTLITEAVQARTLSARKQERVNASTILGGTASGVTVTQPADYLQPLHDALYASKLVSYAQGFMLMKTASEQYNWNLPYGEIALLWRAGCIIRSRFLDDIKASFSRSPVPESLLLDPFFAQELKQAEAGWRKAVSLAIMQGVPAPTFASALTFFDGYRCANGSANILQAQRDYFGSHGYQRVDRDPNLLFHTHWTGDGKEVLLTPTQ